MNDKIYLLIYDYTKDKCFKKYFETEFEKDKFKRKLNYSKKLKVLKDGCNKYYFE